MKELLVSIANTYENYRGTGKLLALFLVSVLIICLYDRGSEGERVNPVWYILCPVAGIAYAFTLVYKNHISKVESRIYRFLCCLFIFIALALSGRFVFMASGFPGVISVIMAVVFLGIYLLPACRLFDDNKFRIFMMLCILILALFGYQSDMLLPVTMLGPGFSIPAVIVHGVLPFVLWFLIGKFGIYIKDVPDSDISDEENDYYLWEEEYMKDHKFINSRTLAAALLVVVIVMIGSVFVMNRKINSLYETTVNLQQQVNELQNGNQ
ncbi:MAG: hypothetical protein IKT17_06700 [Lachnospiraceae bacterium]|nr:hypothetical protein [Lachnospiraceae bacterium]